MRVNGQWRYQRLVGGGSVSAWPSCFNSTEPVALSSDGNRAMLLGFTDRNCGAAVWTFSRSGDTWRQLGSALTGSGLGSLANFGCRLSLSKDGNTTIVAGWAPQGGSWGGAAWIFTHSADGWTQQGGALLTGVGPSGQSACPSVSLSADGSKAIIGNQLDNNNTGAAWVFARANGVWTEQGAKLVSHGDEARPSQGSSVALSSNGDTVIVGSRSRAAWIYPPNR